MNMHTPELLRQHNEAMQRRQRLWTGKTTTPHLVLSQAGPESEPDGPPIEPIICVAKRNKLQDALMRIAQLELDLADARARMLAQAEKICSMNNPTATGSYPEKRAISEIVREVLVDFPGITWEEIKGVRRERRLIEPRHRCMAAIYEQRQDFSLPAIGRIFERDHTTVLHAIRKFETERAAS